MTIKAHELIRAYDRFERGDWNFQFNHELIDDIRYNPDPRNKITYRISKAFRWLFTGGGKNMRKQLDTGSLRRRVSMFFYALKRDKSQPDGYLNEGGIITHWCEDGQYIELFQPSVGQLIADFLEKSPNNPHAKKIAQEIERIGNREGAHRHDHKE